MKPIVILLMGSPADSEHSGAIESALHGFGVETAFRIASAHRTPEHALAVLAEYEGSGRPRVYITVAGRSNALSGFTDPQVAAPVIACPPPGPEADLWSSLRMPPGVATAVVLEPVNAALFAAKILSAHDPAVAEAVRAFQMAQRRRVLDADRDRQGGPAGV